MANLHITLSKFKESASAYTYIFQLSSLKQRGSQEDYPKLKLAPQLADRMGITPDGQNQKAQLKLGIAIQRTFLVGWIKVKNVTAKNVNRPQVYNNKPLDDLQVWINNELPQRKQNCYLLFGEPRCCCSLVECAWNCLSTSTKQSARITAMLGPKAWHSQTTEPPCEWAYPSYISDISSVSHPSQFHLLNSMNYSLPVVTFEFPKMLLVEFPWKQQ